MAPLNLPDIDVRITRDGEKVFIYDVVRKKHIILTPEEWVRQHFAHYLIKELGYPKSLMKIESGLKFNKMSKRSDIVVYNQFTNPHILVECKSDKIKISQQALEQVSVYNQTIMAPFIAITNGMNHYFFKIDFLKGSARQIETLPVYREIP